MTYSRQQTSILESMFHKNPYVNKKQREELQKIIGLTDRQIKIWFQNRRMKAKKDKDRTNENGESVPIPPSGPKFLQSNYSTPGSNFPSPSTPPISCITNGNLHQNYAIKSEERDTTSSSESSASSANGAPQEGSYNWAQMMPTGNDMNLNFASNMLTSSTLNPYYSMQPYYPYPSNCYSSGLYENRLDTQNLPN